MVLELILGAVLLIGDLNSFHSVISGKLGPLGYLDGGKSALVIGF